MKAVAMPLALDHAREERTQWVELVTGTAGSSLAAFGPGTVGDYLPGLGDLTGWGLAYELGGRTVHGGVLTGYWSDPAAVTVWGPLLVRGGQLSVETLEPLLLLPIGCLSTVVEVLSVVAPGMRGFGLFLEEGQPVFQSACVAAVAMAARVIRHLTGRAVWSHEMETRGARRLETNHRNGTVGRWRPAGASGLCEDSGIEWCPLGDYADAPH